MSMKRVVTRVTMMCVLSDYADSDNRLRSETLTYCDDDDEDDGGDDGDHHLVSSCSYSG